MSSPESESRYETDYLAYWFWTFIVSFHRFCNVLNFGIYKLWLGIVAIGIFNIANISLILEICSVERGICSIDKSTMTELFL